MLGYIYTFVYSPHMTETIKANIFLGDIKLDRNMTLYVFLNSSCVWNYSKVGKLSSNCNFNIPLISFNFNYTAVYIKFLNR